MRRKRARSMGSKKEPVNPCEEYNSLKWRLSYASRRFGDIIPHIIYELEV